MGTGCGDAAAMDLALCFQRRRCVVRGCYSHIPKAYPSGPRVQKSSECSTELSFKLRVGFRVRAVRGRTAQCHHTQHTAPGSSSSGQQGTHPNPPLCCAFGAAAPRLHRTAAFLRRGVRGDNCAGHQGIGGQQGTHLHPPSRCCA